MRRQHLLLCGIVAAMLMPSCTGTPETVVEDTRSPQEALFDDGNYAMFIHFGLYSKMEGEWKGKPYYGIAEWIMHPAQAGIPVDEYVAEAATFNPSKFDAAEIVRLAKDAGMKYIVITGKHHEGFAMFDSDVSEFDIADATHLGRDFMGELAEECHANGLGIGFYYSQFQDWTTPGGGGGPKTDAEGREVSFDEYFNSKCIPQVTELTTKYGDIQLIWFDTPGDMGAEYSQKLIDIVRKNQPGALVSSRVGNDMGDYETLGDMEVPVVNHDGRWEGIDVIQVGWAYNRFDNEYKTPEYIVRTLVSTIARGGTYMLNIGPKADGTIPAEAAASLRKAGEWVHAHPEVVEGAGASPWGHALPWGDAVTNHGKLYLTVFDWPSDGVLWVPGIKSDVKRAGIVGGRRLKCRKEGDWLRIDVSGVCREELATVIELTPRGALELSPAEAVDPCCTTSIPVDLAELDGCNSDKEGWMEKFGEWKFRTRVKDLTPESSVRWTAEFKEAGYYRVGLEMKGADQVEWTVTSDEGAGLQDQHRLNSAYKWYDLGWLRVEKPGLHSFTVKPFGGQFESASLSGISFTKVNL